MQTKFFFGIIVFQCLVSFGLVSEEVIVRTPSGNILTLEMDPDLSFKEAVKYIENCAATFDSQDNSYDNDTAIFSSIREENQDEFQDSYYVAAVNEDEELSSSSRGWILDFMFGASPAKAVTALRDYSHQVTAKEKSDIRYIVTHLAKSSWVQLLKEKSSLKKAGDRIDHLHPLRFLGCIFSDEELKAGFHAIKGNGGRIWNEFYGGLADSLTEESRRDNIKREYIQHFADTLELNINLILDPLQRKSWESFVNVLLQQLPRGGNPGRYDQ